MLSRLTTNCAKLLLKFMATMVTMGQFQQLPGFKMAPMTGIISDRGELERIIDQLINLTEKYEKCFCVEVGGKIRKDHLRDIGKPYSTKKVFVYFGWAAD